MFFPSPGGSGPEKGLQRPYSGRTVTGKREPKSAPYSGPSQTGMRRWSAFRVVSTRKRGAPFSLSSPSLLSLLLASLSLLLLFCSLFRAKSNRNEALVRIPGGVHPEKGCPFFSLFSFSLSPTPPSPSSSLSITASRQSTDCRQPTKTPWTYLPGSDPSNDLWKYRVQRGSTRGRGGRSDQADSNPRTWSELRLDKDGLLLLVVTDLMWNLSLPAGEKKREERRRREREARRRERREEEEKKKRERREGERGEKKKRERKKGYPLSGWTPPGMRTSASFRFDLARNREQILGSLFPVTVRPE